MKVYRPRCFVCGDEFSDMEYERRHTDPSSGEDVHEDCCPNEECVLDRISPASRHYYLNLKEAE